MLSKNDAKTRAGKRRSRADSGSLGGKARAKALSPARRHEIAQKAARKRWARRLEAMMKELE